MTKLFYMILGSISLVFMIVCINLNSRINELNNKVSDLEWTVQEHELSIQRLAEQNNAQDVILNKLNREYQMRERQLQSAGEGNARHRRPGHGVPE